MYRLNISFAVEPRVQGPWLGFMKDKMIPALKCRGFNNVILSRVISVEAVDHFTYSLLVEIESMQEYSAFRDGVWMEYAEIADPLFGVQVLWFMSLLKEENL